MLCGNNGILSDMLRFALSLSETTSYITPLLRTKFGERTFSFFGPLSWNLLPAELCTIPDTSVFKNRLKTYFLKLAFDI